MRPATRSRATLRTVSLALALTAALVAAAPAPGAAQTACDFAPEVTIATTPVAGAVGVTVHVSVTAKDPDGDAIASLTADTSSLPAGNDAAFSPNGTNTAGELTWTPQPGQTGSFAVTFTASNALSGSADVTIGVTDTAGAPFVQAPNTVFAHYFEPTTFDVYAGDPDGDAIAALTASGLPFGATFTANASNTSGTFSWTPDLSSGGSYSVTFTASNALSGSATTTVLVPQVDRPPVVLVPSTASGTEGSLLTICARAMDPDGDAITSFTVSPQPPGVQVDVAPGDEVLTFRWTPSIGQAGTYTFQFVASNALAAAASVTVTIAPATGDRPPAVSAPASVSAFSGQALAVDVTAGDPDGDAITSLTAAPLPSGATFDANGTNTAGTLAWTPTPAQAGSYAVVFTAANALSGSATTSISVTPLFEAVLFSTGGDKSIRLGSNKSTWCASLEPVGGLFDLTDVDPGSIALISSGTGSVDRIGAITKSLLIGDRNHDDVPDLEICFSKDDLRRLFSGVTGKQTVPLSLEADLLGGGRVHAEMTVDVFAQGGHLAAVLAPNPPAGEATLSFTTTRPGAARVRVYDVRGRLVRTVLDAADVAAGPHAVRIDGAGTDGARLPSGVYFYRVDAAEGSAAGRFALLR